MTGDEVREQFLSFFESKGHRRVASSSLVPARDPTLLFANAGMNQFKDVFLGSEHRPYRRATTSQKCVRAGGKHNDLENVGRTRRHHTFFEMLGNFSFGDYFKAQAIAFAWELVTEVYGLPKDRLYVTVFREDDEAERLWQTVAGVPAGRIERCGEKDNFWQMGDTGPCGPCSEIFYDYGPEGLEPGESDEPFPADISRYVEIWNLVFMQFDRDEEGNLHPLPKPSIDTGMGLERTAAVLQGKLSNFDTDLFQPIIRRAAELLGLTYGRDPSQDTALRIVADHSRAAAFLIHDDVMPANEGRGYVLRKIIRRALRHARLTGFEDAFLHRMTRFVAERMRSAYPDLQGSVDRVARVVRDEELRYQRNFAVAEREFESAVATVDGTTIPGKATFRLYDTFGLSLDEQQELARERGLGIDLQGFETEMAGQRARARASWKGRARSQAQAVPDLVDISRRCPTEFLGYTRTTAEGLRVLGLLHEGKAVDSVSPGQEVDVVLDRSPFYAEAGGQVGDQGVLTRGSEDVGVVMDVQAPVRGTSVHRVRALLEIAVGDTLCGQVDRVRRDAARRNHTATHLMHAALRRVLGTHVKQAGSVVDPNRLRFDVAHYAPIETREIDDVEGLVNEHILRDTEVVTELMDLDDAVRSGAMALFGEKYLERVRVVSIGDFSKELCGGTHVARTGEIGVFKVLAETSSAAGVRRIEAVSGTGAIQDYREVSGSLRELASLLRARDGGLVGSVQRLLSERRRQEREIEELKARLARTALDELVSSAREVGGLQVVSARVEDMDRGQMRSLADAVRQRIGTGLVVLATVQGRRVALIAQATKDVAGSRVHAGKVISAVARIVGGGGGGRPHMAEAGGRNPRELSRALDSVYGIVDASLSATALR
ncbi:MAG: alanine--tRNA ligase [Bryobacterales bacterium]|nr:alanine--tRNA ligase [Bryobacterales bacterium]